MSTRSPKPPAETRYIISFTIRDGDNAYRDESRALFDHEPTEREVIFALVENVTCNEWELLAEDQKKVWEEWNHSFSGLSRHEAFAIPGDYRIISNVSWEKDEYRLLEAAPKLLEFIKDLVNEPFRIEVEDEREKTIFEAKELIANAEGRD